VNPCGRPDCPVPEPAGWPETVELARGSVWWRATRHDPIELTPPLGSTRFAPLPDRHHAYLGATRTVSLLETALHSAAGETPTVYLSFLDTLVVHQVVLDETISVAHLRDPQLAALGITRDQLVNTTIQHYPCTRWWAARLSDAGYNGIVWHSRQADLYAQANPDGLLADVLQHKPVEIAVLWSPTPTPLFSTTGMQLPVLENGEPSRLLNELANLIGAPIE